MPPGLTGELKDYVQQLLAYMTNMSHELTETKRELAKVKRENQALRNEVAQLKGLTPQPKFKPSGMLKATDNEDEGKGDGTPGSGQRPGSAKRSKTASLTTHATRVVKLVHVPRGSVFKGYADYTVQDVVLQAHNTLVRRERWCTPEGLERVAEMPPEYLGSHFGPTLRSFVLHQHHACHVTQPLLLSQLREWGVDISSGQINSLLARDLGGFALAKSAVLAAGLLHSPVITVDDSGAPHRGDNGYVTVISGPAFAAFQSTSSKSRINFLRVLQGGTASYLINDRALAYMTEHGVPQALVAALCAARGKLGSGPLWLTKLLMGHCVVSEDDCRVVTEGAMWGALAHRMHPQQAIVSDGARQFVLGLHGLCWVHSERLVYKLLPGTPEERLAQQRVRREVWTLFKQLKRFKTAPSPVLATALEAEFVRVFSQKTCFEGLNRQLARLYEHKDDLLLVLRRPDVPLHTNQSESDVRSYVTMKKVSGGTRDEVGRACRDTFATLNKTCRKLGVSFWSYLQDCLTHSGAIAPLPELIERRMQQLAVTP